MKIEEFYQLELRNLIVALCFRMEYSGVLMKISNVVAGQIRECENFRNNNEKFKNKKI